tara:strand:- start:382 stop:567 length:186 start_codon:yes stop_codon:yes gene_type:complete
LGILVLEGLLGVVIFFLPHKAGQTKVLLGFHTLCLLLRRAGETRFVVEVRDFEAVEAQAGG